MNGNKDEKTTLNMTLIKPAKKQGGDKYEAMYEGESVIFYIPQKISRKGGMPFGRLKVEIGA